VHSLQATRSRRDGETERLRGFEVDNELVLGRRLHRKIGWLLSLENSIHVASCLPVLLDEVRSVSNEAAGRNEVAIGVDPGSLCRAASSMIDARSTAGAPVKPARSRW